MSIKLAMNRFLGGFRLAELCRDFHSLNEASRHSYFGKFLPSAVAIKSIKNYLSISCFALAPKVLVKLAPRTGLFGVLRGCIFSHVRPFYE